MSEIHDRWEGVISLDVQLVLTATSGRPKHTDTEEQGTEIAEAVQRELQRVFADSIDTTIGTVSMTGSRAEAWFDWDDLTR